MKFSRKSRELELNLIEKGKQGSTTAVLSLTMMSLLPKNIDMLSLISDHNAKLFIAVPVLSPETPTDGSHSITFSPRTYRMIKSEARLWGHSFCSHQIQTH